MKISERSRLRDNISNLITRLGELKGRKIEINSYWESIHTSMDAVRKLFGDILDVLVEQSKTFLAEVESSSRAYSMFHEYINLLYISVDCLRRDFFDLFPGSFRNRLYVYLFMRDLLDTFPEPCARTLRDLRYIMIPTGDILTWAVHKTLCGRAYAWFDWSLKDRIKEISESEVIGFECDPEEPLHRQIIEGHEIIHVVVDKHPIIKTRLEQVIQSHQGEVKDVFQESFSRASDYIKELFCDFGATWHFGPAYGKVFIDEIAFSTKLETRKHPQRVLRVLFILEALRGMNHPYKENIQSFYHAYRHEYQTVKSQDIQFLLDEFTSVLGDELKITKYRPKDVKDRIKRYFEHNIPYLYEDVREFLNNLPEKSELSGEGQEHFEDVVLESVRKNALWHQFAAQMREPGVMFPMPEAF